MRSALIAALPSFAAAIATLAPAPLLAASPNPLIGTWLLAQGAPETCGASLTFTASTAASTYPDARNNETHRTTYNVSPARVYVIGNAANQTGYDIKGPNSISWTGARSTCGYQRKGTQAPAAVAAAPGKGNPLFGLWTLVEGNPVACFKTITFTASKEATTQPDPSWNQTWPVGYEVSGDLVKVVGSGNVSPYRVTGPTTMEWAGTGSACKFKRG